MGLLKKEQIWELIKERNMKTTSDISAMLKDLFNVNCTNQWCASLQYSSVFRSIIRACIVVHLSRQKIRHFIMNLIIQATASASSSSIAGK